MPKCKSQSKVDVFCVCTTLGECDIILSKAENRKRIDSSFAARIIPTNRQAVRRALVCGYTVLSLVAD